MGLAFVHLEVGPEEVDDGQIAGCLAVGQGAGLQDEPVLGAVGMGVRVTSGATASDSIAQNTQRLCGQNARRRSLWCALLDPGFPPILDPLSSGDPPAQTAAHGSPNSLSIRPRRLIVAGMPISVTVPDDVVAALKLPPRSVESDLRKELAVHLVAEGLLPVASGCRLAGWSRLAFERLLGERQIPAGYTTDDLDQDVHTLSSG